MHFSAHVPFAGLLNGVLGTGVVASELVVVVVAATTALLSSVPGGVGALWMGIEAERERRIVELRIGTWKKSFTFFL